MILGLLALFSFGLLVAVVNAYSKIKELRNKLYKVEDYNMAVDAYISLKHMEIPRVYASEGRSSTLHAKALDLVRYENETKDKACDYYKSKIEIMNGYVQNVENDVKKQKEILNEVVDYVYSRRR